MKLQTVRGTTDLLGDDLHRYNALVKIAYDKAALFGYEGIVTPIIEQTAVFTKPLGETSDIVGKEMYTFLDRGGESITLRPEGTAPVLRAIMNEGLTQTLPQKRITHGPFFRYERPQKGRYRQFHQISVECIGIESYHADVEVIEFAHSILSAAGVPDLVLHINTLGDQESRLAYRAALVSFFEQRKNDLSEDSRIRLEKNPLRILDSKDEGDRAICALAPKIADYLTPKSSEFFANLCKALDALNIYYKCDPTLVRGMDYYCHTVFEFKSANLGAQDTVLGGGRYDGLMEQMGGPAMPAVGFGCGMERLALIGTNLSNEPNPLTLCLIPIDEAEIVHTLMMMQKLRAANISCEMLASGKVTKRLTQAARKKAIYTTVIGSDESASGLYTIRKLEADQDSGDKEVKLTLDQLIEKCQ